MIASPSGIVGKASALGRDIKLGHSVFALPYALLAMLMSAGQERVRLSWAMAGLIVLCMVLARTFAMSVNRLADSGIDAKNPRTAGRAIPSGRLDRGFVAWAIVLCAAGLMLSASGFWWLSDNPWPLLASPLVLVWLGGYSYAKRFTWLCHLWLGLALAMSPIAAVLAVAPAYLGRPEPYLLAGMVACWVAGFDVIYALQDTAFDRAHGLWSMPAKLGDGPALWIGRGLHVAALAWLVLLGLASPLLSWGFAAGVAMVAVLLVIEHALVWRSRTHHIDTAFFTINGVISLLLGGLGAADVWRLGGW